MSNNNMSNNSNISGRQPACNLQAWPKQQNYYKSQKGQAGQTAFRDLPMANTAQFG